MCVLGTRRRGDENCYLGPCFLSIKFTRSTSFCIKLLPEIVT